MRTDFNSLDLIKILIVGAMLGFGLYQIIITRDGDFVAAEASLREAYSTTHTFYSQERHQTKTRYYFKYQYTFRDQVYTSSRYRHVNPGLAMGVARFKDAEAGTPFTVYVNPNNPAYAVVQKGQPLFIYVLALTGLFGALNCWLEWRMNHLYAYGPERNKERIEQVRKYLMRSGGVTALGIFVTLILYIFAV